MSREFPNNGESIQTLSAPEFHLGDENLHLAREEIQMLVFPRDGKV